MEADGSASPRARARARLDRAVADVAGGSGALVVVAGALGSGRTELVRAAVAGAGSLAVAWSGTPGAEPEPLETWTRAAASLAGADGILAALLDAPSGARRPRWRARLVDELRQRAGRGPVLWVLDDLDRADPASRDLVGWLAPQLASMAMGIVATVGVGHAADAASSVDLARVGEVVMLRGMTLAELAPVVEEAVDRRVPDEVLAVIHRRTAGTPLVARELARDLADRNAVESPDVAARLVPTTVRVQARHELARLPPPARRVVEVAAVIGTSGDTRMLDDVLAIDGGDLGRQRPDATVGIEFLRWTDGTWSFSYELLRDAVAAQVPGERRDRLGGAAVQWLLAAAEDARQAVDAAAAVVLLRRAQAMSRSVALDPEVRARVRVELGDALLAAGRAGEARVQHAAGAAAARGVDPVLLARASLGLGSGTSGFEVPLLDQSQLDLLEEALADLPADEPGWEARLRARLAVALTHGDQEARRRRLADRAVELAHESGDPLVLATCLAARCDVRAGPDHCEEREETATEVIALGHQRDPVVELLGYRLRLVARLEQGDISGAEADLDAFAHRSDALGDPWVAWYPPLWRAARHLMYGRAEEAARCEREARRIGEEAGSQNAMYLTTTHRWWSLVEQGRHEEFASQLEELDDLPPAPWVRVALALGLAESGRSNAAVVQPDAVADSLAAQPRDSEWLPMLAQVAHVVGLVGGHPVGAVVYDLLAPFRHRHLVEGIGAALLGSVERSLGLLAAARGDRDAAQAHFTAAATANRRLGGAALLARTLRDAGVALDDPVRLEEAAVLYDELGWNRRVTEARDRARALGGGAGRRAGGSRTVPVRATFRPAADGWLVGWQGATTHVRDVKGMHDLARLLDRPDRDVPALDLATAGRGEGVVAGGRPDSGAGDGVEGALGPALDDEARRAYRARLAELEDDVETARAANDPVATERAVTERDALVEALRQAYGLGGRARPVGDVAERARTTVTSRIRDAIARIAEADPALGRHLDNAIRTGRMCAYRPEMPVEWDR